ncbi:branched-chain amino acid transport system II carrier protein [Clostridium sediminicola]|uniref:branched-chain amino acid transport system II carrier protein n=1 Tax=Clostridium sediminicola TaxID=3114879 RepID=UPI0031F1EC17
MQKKTKDVLVLGLALFAMFFGAGNLIFPPALGLISGKNWIICGFGFFLTAIGMPLLGIVGISKVGSTIDDVGNKVHPVFSKIFGTVIILAIGPLLAIPKTGATTFEMGIKPLFPEINGIIVSIIFFALTLYFVIKPSQIVDKIGKILTPMLLLTMLIIIVKGIISPLGAPLTEMSINPFSKGFTEGYQTMDALASLVFGGVILSAIINKGYQSEKEQIRLTVSAGAIAALGLAVIYGGLIYLGSSVNGVYPSDIAQTDLLVGITTSLLGGFGKIALAIIVSLACLTTSIGLTATVGSYFNKLSRNKVSYKSIVIATVLFSGIFANIGVQKIVVFAVPLLVTVYPVALVLIIMCALNDFIPDTAYIGGVIGALMVSLYDGFMATGITIGFLENIIVFWGNLINKIPLASAGFAWILPSIILAVITSLIFKRRATV